jgi:antitoxin ParD1/3/4
MNVSLTPELERLVAEKVEAGMYASASEVVRDALRLLFQAEELRLRRLEQLDSEIQIGIDQADRGDMADGQQSRRRAAARVAAGRR